MNRLFSVRKGSAEYFPTFFVAMILLAVLFPFMAIFWETVAQQIYRSTSPLAVANSTLMVGVLVFSSYAIQIFGWTKTKISPLQSSKSVRMRILKLVGIIVSLGVTYGITIMTCGFIDYELLSLMKSPEWAIFLGCYISVLGPTSLVIMSLLVYR